MHFATYANEVRQPLVSPKQLSTLCKRSPIRDRPGPNARVTLRLRLAHNSLDTVPACLPRSDFYQVTQIKITQPFLAVSNHTTNAPSGTIPPINRCQAFAYLLRYVPYWHISLLVLIYCRTSKILGSFSIPVWTSASRAM